MAKFRSMEMAVWSIFSLLFCVLPLLLCAQPSWRDAWQLHGLFPGASHTASAFMVTFAVPFEALNNCCFCWLLKLMHRISPVGDKILLLEDNYSKYSMCWESISSGVKVNTQLLCKTVWYYVLIVSIEKEHTVLIGIMN